MECLVWWSVTNGRRATAYEPAGTVTRGQMASSLANVITQSGGALPASAGGHFADDDGTTHEDDINAAAAAGLTGGSNGRYRPASPVRRDQMASFLTRLLDLIVEDDGAVEVPPSTRSRPPLI